MIDTNETLKAVLTALIEQHMSHAPTRQLRGPSQRHPGALPQVTAERIAEDLVQQAVTSGLPLRSIKVAHRPLGGGNTAETVTQLTLHAPFVFKLDSRARKLAAEGHMMRNARNSAKLTERSRNAWPIVYAIRDEAPYAYLMEYFPREEGWASLEDRLYPGPGALATSDSDALRFMHAVLDVLFETYEASKDTRSLPNLAEDYIGRIGKRLADVAHDTRFASRPLIINGVNVEPWQRYLDRLESNKDFINEITPAFTTIAHGDPNPGNLMLRTSMSSIEVKLIDPKEWQTGDYLFDIAKITHFLESTGPIEKPASGVRTEGDYLETGGSAELRYHYDTPTWTRSVADACLDRVRQFAEANGDKHWLARYELAMASNLLGLPAGRLKDRPHAALALYGDGLLWLQQFCERLPNASPATTPVPATSPITEVEPEPLARARQRVRNDAPQVVDAVDRRGFRTLHWQPRRTNVAGKPVELSLEHEARLKPTSSRALDALKEALATSDAMDSGNVLLPGHPHFGAWSIRRVQRNPGAQSVDRYWDLKGAGTEQRLIPRMMTLRERLKTSKFMTWESIDEARPLNLELPFVAYQDTSVIVRLEFNWIDLIGIVFEEFNAAQPKGTADNSLVLAARIGGIEKGEFEPRLEHTTFREKYSVLQGEDELFQLNVDHVVAQSLQTHRIATFTDIDMAPSRMVDDKVLASLIAFSQAMADRFRLVPIGATKAYCGASMIGLCER